MAKLDYEYLAGILEKARAGDGNAFAEIYTATYYTQYQVICQDTQDKDLALDLLLRLYTSAFMDIHSLSSPKYLLSWLDQIRCNICAEFCKTVQKTSSRNIPISHKEAALDAFTANRILTNALAVCGIAPSDVPVDVLETWMNYTKPGIYRVRYLIYSMLAILVLLPLLFVKPSVKAEWTGSGDGGAEYSLSIHSLLPVSSVSAELNGSPADLEKAGYREYRAVAGENGTLDITVRSVNGQTYTRSYDLTPFDTEPPVLIASDRRSGKFYLTVRETYSGIDYEGITGLTPESYDPQSGLLVFPVPDAEVTVTIPDNAGNTLTVSLSP